ncbi:unnamed protein product, partial [marine sediment metagenome]
MPDLFAKMRDFIKNIFIKKDIENNIGDINKIVIHGGVADLEWILGNAECCKDRSWTRKKWKKVPALVSKDGKGLKKYYGQKYDPKYFDLVEDGWDHDHCEICMWPISENEGYDIGYFDGDSDWIC